ncbi:unnamed protein product [Cuscuta europaea]|uniref:Uncharacterized protein n=1 Tax=Cuscuta europaea TaxID=41803 RepID=A0A9P0ZSL0_CUSEU|nr:unnamed protein product [Cuscuta europaea]
MSICRNLPSKEPLSARPNPHGRNAPNPQLPRVGCSFGFPVCTVLRVRVFALTVCSVSDAAKLCRHTHPDRYAMNFAANSLKVLYVKRTLAMNKTIRSTCYVQCI